MTGSWISACDADCDEDAGWTGSGTGGADDLAVATAEDVGAE